MRLVSKDCNAIFEGSGILVFAFFLNNVTGVEIDGVTIQNYLSTGISISGGTGNRIIRNKIFNIGNRGISVAGSTANLIWKNQVENVRDGVELISSSTNNWVIENRVTSAADDGFETFLSNDRDNALIGNFARNCGGNCFEIFGINCLVFNNTAIVGSNSGYLFFSGNNSVAIENRAEKSMDGVLLSAQNVFLALNELKNNSGSGLEIRTDFNIALRNRIEFNRDSGIVLGPNSNGNFIYQNKVECNTPFDIVPGGTDNNLLRNITGCRQDCHSCQNCENQEDSF